MKSPITDKEMVLVSNLVSKKRYYLCTDSGMLVLANDITKFDLKESQKLGNDLLQRIKA